MIRELHILEPLQDIKHCIIGLAGRGNSIDDMLQIAKSLEFPNTLIISIRPRDYAWYPIPHNSKNQKEAVDGLSKAVWCVKDKISKIHSIYGLKPQNTTLLGFSAGAVVGLQVALNSNEQQYHSVIALSGAILQPSSVPFCQQSTQYILQHNKDDACFNWYERYMPMKESLIAKRYKLAFIENYTGGHRVTLEDMVAISNFLSINKQLLHSQTKALTPSKIKKGLHV